MSLLTKFLGATAALALTAGAALADPAIIYHLGGKFDKSFNDAAFHGAEKWAKETGGKFREVEIQSEAQREQVLRRLAESGANPQGLWDDDEDWRGAERVIDDVGERFGRDLVRPASLLRPTAELGPSKRRPRLDD